MELVRVATLSSPVTPRMSRRERRMLPTLRCIELLPPDAASGNREVWAGSEDGVLTSWELHEGSAVNARPTRTWQAHRGAVNRIVHLRQWNILLTASADASVAVWDCDAKELEKADVQKLCAHTGGVNDVRLFVCLFVPVPLLVPPLPPPPPLVLVLVLVLTSRFRRCCSTTGSCTRWGLTAT